jgi:hypothetical protein
MVLVLILEFLATTLLSKNTLDSSSVVDPYVLESSGSELGLQDQDPDSLIFVQIRIWVQILPLLRKKVGKTLIFTVL